MLNNEDFENLFQAHSRLVRSHLYRLGVRSELDDLTQEVFIKVWKHLEKLENDKALKAWILKIATNAAFDYGRKKKLTYLEEIEDAALVTDSDEAALNQVSASEAAEQALKILSWDQRTTVVLHYFEDMNLNEIAEQLDIPLGTVKSRLNSARDKMQVYLKSKGVA